MNQDDINRAVKLCRVFGAYCRPLDGAVAVCLTNSAHGADWTLCYTTAQVRTVLKGAAS